jgi:5,10-methylenetetrahydrofolate reductase
MALQHKFEAAEFTVLAEMPTPKGADASLMVAHALQAKDRVDAFVIPDMCNAVLRMSALSGAAILQHRGMETIMQICSRDRNRLALQADLLGANACGISAVMTVNGDDPTFGDHHEALVVNDLDHLDLLYAIHGLQAGKDMAGAPLCGAPRFIAGSTVNPGLRGQALELEIEKMNRRVEAGAQFFVTPPVFAPEVLEPFLRRVDHRRLRIVPTILLLKSIGMARYIQFHQKHIHLPGALVERLRAAGDKRREAIRIARELMDAWRARQFCGVLIAAAGWEQCLPDLLG